MKILVATSNPHKLDEIRAIIVDGSVELVSLDMLAGASEIVEPVEDRDTFEGNAELKARYYAKATGMLCLADDSGLEVDALGGEPGVRSARYSGADGPRAERDRANRRALLKNLGDTPIEKRTARFVCAMALVDGRARGGLGEAPRSHVGLSNEHVPPPGAPRGNAGLNTDQSTVMNELKVIAVVRGTLEGRILTKEEADDPAHPERGRGSNGFGYDPIVYMPDRDKTVAQLTSDDKNEISHRGSAVCGIYYHICTLQQKEVQEKHRRDRTVDMEVIKEFMSAAVDDHAKARKLLKEYPRLLDTNVTCGETPLHSQVISGQIRAIEFLAGEGFEVDSKNTFGDTPLMDVAMDGDVEVAEVLLRLGADSNATSYMSDCPLFCAIKSEHPEMVKLLLDHGASVKYKSNWGDSALDLLEDLKSNRAEIEHLLREAIASGSGD